jgi:integrase
MPLRARNGFWHFRFKMRGKPYNGTTGFEATERNRRAAEKFEESERQKAAAAAADQRIETLDFATAAGKFIAWCEDVEYRSKPSSAQRLKVSFTALVAFFGNLHVGKIDDSAIEAFKESRIVDCGVKDITLRHDLHALSLFFQYSEKKRWSKGNPVRQVAMPSDRDAVRMTVIPHEQEKAYFAEAMKHVDKAGRPNLYDVGRLMINQGLRPEEIMHAKKSNFDEKAHTLTITAGKTRAAQRVIDLMDESFAILKARMLTGGPWLFPSERYVGNPITKLQGSHDKACRDSGVSFVPYDLRHTFGTRMATEHKTDPFTLASIMGHSNLRTIMRYVHPQQQERKRAIERYEAAQRRRKLKVVAS